MKKEQKKEKQSTGWTAPLPKTAKAASEWFLMIPYGVYSHPKGIQRFMRAEANEVVHYFKSIRGLINRNFRGLPIEADKEHCGLITKLQAREDGLWARVKWNSVGENVLSKKTFKHIAPVWELRAVHPDVFEPFKINRAILKRESLLAKPKKKAVKKRPRKLNTQSVTKSLSGNGKFRSNREKFLDLVQEHMSKTGKHYLESWNSVKRKHNELYCSF